MFETNKLSIDIGSKDIKFIYGRCQKDGVFIDKAFLAPTPSQSFSDGKILDMQKLALRIKDTLKQHKVNARKVIFTINSLSIITREVVLPVVKESELEGMVKFEIEQYLPVSINEYDIEYRLLSEIETENGKKQRLWVAAAPKSTVEGYINLAKEIGAVPAAIDINSNALAKLFETQVLINGESYSPDKTVSIIDIGYATSNVLIISEGKIQFNRLLSRGGRELDNTLANTYGISPEEAEKRKVQLKALVPQQAYISASERMSDPIGFTIDSWVQDIGRIFQYYSSRSVNNRIDEVYIAGGSANLEGLSEFFSSQLNIKVGKIETLSSIHYSKTVTGVNLEYFLSALGALIRR